MLSCPVVSSSTVKAMVSSVHSPSGYVVAVSIYSVSVPMMMPKRFCVNAAAPPAL